MAPSRRRQTQAAREASGSGEDAVETRLFWALRRIAQRVEIDSRRLVKGCGLTAPQLVCLRAAVAHGRTTATDIAREVFLSPSTMVGIIDRLESKGLLKRLRDRQDRRVVFLTPTAAGRQLVAQTKHPVALALGTLAGGMSAKEQELLAGSLEKLARILEQNGWGAEA